MKKLFICIAAPLIVLCLNTYSYSYEYIIIKGANVSFKSSPVVNSKVIDTFKTDELVFLIQKSDKEILIGNDNYYWYKVKRLDKKTGWVYGKYCYYIDESKIPEKYYKQILDDLFSNTFTTDGIDIEIFNVGFEFIENKNLIMLKYFNIEPPMAAYGKQYYNITENNIKSFFETFYNAKVIFKGNYIFDINDRHLFIRKKIKDDEYNIVVKNYITGDDYKKKFYDSYLEFDDKTMILTKYYRDAPGVPMRIEKYHFNEQIDKFEKIE
jgi:hypothetical protein